ncbi:MAG: recombination protein RecR, partial [Candidatus Omnitrophota bacterium]
MSGFPLSMKQLAEEFARMPGIGAKTSERLAFYILRSSKIDAGKLAEAIIKVKESVRFCKLCNNLSDEDVCGICNSSSRDKDTLCIVEEPNDIVTIEKAGDFNG